jgi:hypothetical protein
MVRFFFFWDFLFAASRFSSSCPSFEGCGLRELRKSSLEAFRSAKARLQSYRKRHEKRMGFKPLRALQKRSAFRAKTTRVPARHQLEECARKYCLDSNYRVAGQPTRTVRQ